MNKVILLGRMAADPELRQTNTGISVTSFTIAVDRPFSKGPERQTDWVDIVAWRNTAEFVCKYFTKGKPIIIDGYIQTRSYEDKAGAKRKAVEVQAENVEFVPGTKGDSVRPMSAGDFAPPSQPAPVVFASGDADEFTAVDDEDLPF